MPLLDCTLTSEEWFNIFCIDVIENITINKCHASMVDILFYVSLDSQEKTMLLPPDFIES